jgi:methyl-branched lipid omega-hydroxylase
MPSALSALRVDNVDLSDTAFWDRSAADRDAAFAVLRSSEHPAFYPESGFPFADQLPGYYALVRYADVTEASRNPEVFCSREGATNHPDPPRGEFSEYFSSMINIDDPQHSRLRRIVSRTFTPRMIRQFEHDVQRAAERIVSDLLETGPCDFVEHVAARLPLKIICDIMGIPERYVAMVLRNTNIILSGGDPEYLSDDIDEAESQILYSGRELAALVTDLARHRVRKPTDDLLSALANANIEGERLTSAELASFFILLVVAGNETTRNAISHSLVQLSDFPEQRALLLADFDTRIGGAVEEIVRHASPVIFMRRTLTTDYLMNGHRYRTGDKVMLFYWSANRDESVFDQPSRFDITRSPNPHVSFGAPGPHFCLGAHLARREIAVLLRELLHRVPSIRVAAEPDRLRSSFINGIKRLPCDFSA